jgi:6-pyruvoyltetrahydropterin/6-carboxytetrahydropterin synthase
MSRLLYTAAVPFEAARHVDLLPVGHRSRRVHGHSFLASVRAPLPAGWASFPGGEVGDLRTRLTAALAPLDYCDLNTVLACPTDENLARWLRERADLPEATTFGIQSTQDEGVELDHRQQAHLWRRYRLQSAHRLPNVPAGHQCGRLHGHGFEVILHVQQDVGGCALGLDYDALDVHWAPLHALLDHACLNDIPGLEIPTSELFAAWLWQRLKPGLPELRWVTVYETAQCGANFDGQQFRIWKETTLDSALVLRHAPAGDPRRRIHGHTYTLRLHLHAPLDTVLGWTMDFGDVKELFGPTFRALDHRPLHELTGTDSATFQPDAASLAAWIRAQVAATLPQVDRIDLLETRGCGVVLSWGAEEPVLPV